MKRHFGAIGAREMRIGTGAGVTAMIGVAVILVSGEIGTRVGVVEGTFVGDDVVTGEFGDGIMGEVAGKVMGKGAATGDFVTGEAMGNGKTGATTGEVAAGGVMGKGELGLVAKAGEMTGFAEI